MAKKLHNKKITSTPPPTNKKQKTTSKKQLNLYFKSYKGRGVNDVPYWNLFQNVHRFIKELNGQQQSQQYHGEENTKAASDTAASSTATTTTTCTTISSSGSGGVQRVLYPGCHRHVTPAIFFDFVTFIDYDKNMKEFYDDTMVTEYVVTEKSKLRNTNIGALGTADDDDDNMKEKKQDNDDCDEEEIKKNKNYEFYCLNVCNQSLPKFSKKKSAKSATRGEKIAKSSDVVVANTGSDSTTMYDILFSLNAGVISSCCTKYIRTGGYLLVNDSHSDARIIHTKYNQVWKLIAYYEDDEGSRGKFISNNLDRCFQVINQDGGKQKKRKTTKAAADGDGTITTPATTSASTTTVPMTVEQAEESVRIGTIKKRSFRVAFEPMFYLFQKI